MTSMPYVKQPHPRRVLRDITGFIINAADFPWGVSVQENVISEDTQNSVVRDRIGSYYEASYSASTQNSATWEHTFTSFPPLSEQYGQSSLH